MKKLILIGILSFLFISTIGINNKTEKKEIKNNIETTIYKQTIADGDIFKKDLQQEVLDFIENVGVNPDSCYIPFKDENLK